MGHQALHFSKAIQRSVGWPFCVERREGRGSDEEAPSISPMRGSARLPLGILGWPFYLERREGRGVDEKAPSISPMKGECLVMSEKVCKILLVLSPMLGFPKHGGNL